MHRHRPFVMQPLECTKYGSNDCTFGRAIMYPLPSLAPFHHRRPLQPTAVPSSIPSNFPSRVPSSNPTSIPTTVPSTGHLCAPTNIPSTIPTIIPTSTVPVIPTAMPSMAPSCPSSSPGVPTGCHRVRHQVLLRMYLLGFRRAFHLLCPHQYLVVFLALSVVSTIDNPTSVPTVAPSTVPSCTPTKPLTIPTIVRPWYPHRCLLVLLALFHLSAIFRALYESYCCSQHSSFKCVRQECLPVILR